MIFLFQKKLSFIYVNFQNKSHKNDLFLELIDYYNLAILCQKY